MCLETAARRITELVELYFDPAKPVWGGSRLYPGAASSDGSADQTLLQFATGRIREQREAQAEPSYDKGPQRTEGDGTTDGGGRDRQRRPPSKDVKGGVARGRLAASRSARELFPLPRWRLPELPVADSVRSRARRRRERLVFKMGNEAVDALNWLAGCRGGPAYFDPDPMQFEVLERICELASRRYPGPDAPSERAAVRRLLRGHTPYDGAGCLTRVAPFRKGLVSLPETVEGCPPFEGAAPPEVQRFLKEHPERMLRADSPSSTVAPYIDPALKRSAKTYRQFISDLLEIALPDGLGPWSEEAERLLVSYSLHVGLADVKDCFHRLRLPGWLSEYFCLPRINECQASSLCPQLRESPLSDRGRPPVFGPSVPKGHVSHCVCVDNLGVASIDQPIVVTDAIAQLVAGFDQRGLLLHGSSVGTEVTRGTLSVFHTVYAFMRESYAELSVLWHEARQELETVIAGRAQERARFREPAAVETDGAAGAAPAARRGAREAALEAAGFWRDADGERRLAEGAIDDDGQAAAWEADPSFPEVPAAGPASSRRRTEQVQRWRFEEGILIKETPPPPPGTPARRPRLRARAASAEPAAPTPRQLVARESGSRTPQGPQLLPKLTAARRAQDWRARLSLAELSSAPKLPGRERDLQALPLDWSHPIVASSVDGGSTSDDQQVEPAGERREGGPLKEAARRRALTTAPGMGEAMAGYVNHMSFEGPENAKGCQERAGLMHRFGEFSRQDKARPLALRCGLAWRMGVQSVLPMAVFLLAMVSGYL
ncbi:unnamed protein product, partial [Prorocentrum cordatum]